MTRKVPIRANIGNVLAYLGQLYASPVDALKEYTSNAVDEWNNALTRGTVSGRCEVSYFLEKDKVIVEYSAPGMDEEQFENALQRVADSIKKGTAQIGQLGIGLFAFNQIGDKATFYSRPETREDTIQVVIRKGDAEAEFERAHQRESLSQPGMRIVIEALLVNPWKVRGPLSPDRLQKAFGERFDSYLRAGRLRIQIRSRGKTYEVSPPLISLPSVGDGYTKLYIGKRSDIANCQWWFDPVGKSSVAIRHAGVSVVDDVRQLEGTGHGIEESIFGSGYLKAFIDADFLTPLPARRGFRTDESWIGLMDALSRIAPPLAAEVEALKLRTREEHLSKIWARAREIAFQILGQEDFRHLEFLGGQRRERGPVQHPGKTVPAGESTGSRSREDPGTREAPHGLRVNYSEEMFPEGPKLHSKFEGSVIKINNVNPDYLREMKGPEDAQIAYGALMIGKETVAYNDPSKRANEYLETLVSYLFQVKEQIGSSLVTGKRAPGRPKRLLPSAA